MLMPQNLSGSVRVLAAGRPVEMWVGCGYESLSSCPFMVKSQAYTGGKAGRGSRGNLENSRVWYERTSAKGYTMSMSHFGPGFPQMGCINPNFAWLMPCFLDPLQKNGL